MSAPARPGPIPADYSVIRLRNARRAQADRWAVPWGHCGRTDGSAVSATLPVRTSPTVLSDCISETYRDRTEGAGL